jgi:hypothetical protein
MRVFIALLIGVALGVAGLFGVLTGSDVRLGKTYFGSWTSEFEVNPGVTDLESGKSEPSGGSLAEPPPPKPPADIPQQK